MVETSRDFRAKSGRFRACVRRTWPIKFDRVNFCRTRAKFGRAPAKFGRFRTCRTCWRREEGEEQEEEELWRGNEEMWPVSGQLWPMLAKFGPPSTKIRWSSSQNLVGFVQMLAELGQVGSTLANLVASSRIRLSQNGYGQTHGTQSEITPKSHENGFAEHVCAPRERAR